MAGLRWKSSNTNSAPPAPATPWPPCLYKFFGCCFSLLSFDTRRGLVPGASCFFRAIPDPCGPQTLLYNAVVPTESRTEYIAARSEEVPERGRLVVDIHDDTIGLFRIDGKLYAY